MTTKTLEIGPSWVMLETGPVMIETVTYDGEGACVLLTSDDPEDPTWNQMAFARIARGDGAQRIGRLVSASRFLFATVEGGRGGELTYTVAIPRGRVLLGRRRLV